MTFALILLALHQNVQEKFLHEIENVLGDPDKKVPSYEDLSNFKYGQAILNETLRMYPIATTIPKWAPKDTVLLNGRLPVPAGTFIDIHIAGVHYNPKHWGPDAHAFRPERFLGDYNRDAFLPFSDGARACLGKRFAQIEALTALALLVRHFKIDVTEGQDKERLLDCEIVLTLAPAKPVSLTLTPRC
jgi:cytochrome P450